MLLLSVIPLGLEDRLPLSADIPARPTMEKLTILFMPFSNLEELLDPRDDVLAMVRFWKPHVMNHETHIAGGY